MWDVTKIKIAAGIIKAGQKVYKAPDGKVSATGDELVGTALDSVEDNEQVEVLLNEDAVSSPSSTSHSSGG